MNAWTWEPPRKTRIVIVPETSDVVPLKISWKPPPSSTPVNTTTGGVESTRTVVLMLDVLPRLSVPVNVYR